MVSASTSDRPGPGPGHGAGCLPRLVGEFCSSTAGPQNSGSRTTRWRGRNRGRRRGFDGRRLRPDVQRSRAQCLTGPEMQTPIGETGGRFWAQNSENGRNSVRRPPHTSLTDRNCEELAARERKGLPMVQSLTRLRVWTEFVDGRGDADAGARLSGPRRRRSTPSALRRMARRLRRHRPPRPPC